MSDKPSVYEVDSSETSIRIWVLSAVMIGWFISSSLSTSTYIATHGSVYGGESLLDWISTFISDYLIFVVVIVCYLLAEWNIERRFNFLQLPMKYDYVNNLVLDAYRNLDFKNPLEVRFLDLEEPYSFTYGRRSKEAKLVLSKGLVETLNEEELKSVVLHELSHIKNKDLVFMTWGVSFLKALKYWLAIQLLLVPVSIIRYYFQGRLWSYIGFYLSITIPTIVAMIIIFTILPSLVINSVSRVREFLADTYTCEFVEEKYLKSSLAKISKALVLSRIKRSLFPSHLSIISFSSSSFPNSILRHTVATHPSIKERVEAVEMKKYLMSWENACKIDRRAAYAGIIAFIVALIGFMISATVETLGVSLKTGSYIFLTTVIPLLFIFWINGRNFLHLLERIRLSSGEKILGLFKILVRDLISASILVGVLDGALWIIFLAEATSLFWISFPVFLLLGIAVLLYTLYVGSCLLFWFLSSHIGRR